MLFNRVASLIVGPEGSSGKEISGLRFAFSIQKGATKSPNQCTLRIWNCATDTKALLEVVGNVVILKAGYAEDTGAVTIFSGNITRALTVREGPDLITELELHDGFLEFRDSKVSVGFPKGVSTVQVIDYLSKKFGLPVRVLPSDVASRQYPSGFAFVGRVRDGMDRACDYMGLEWSIQNREIQIIKKGGTYKKQAYVLSPDTGLLGSPMLESKTMTEKAAAKKGITANQPGVQVTLGAPKNGTPQEKLRVLGYKVRSFLQPSLEPGGYVQLKTTGIDGEFFRVEELTHSGDTHGNEWQSEITLRYAV